VSEADRKRAERGGFGKRIFLEYVDQARQGPAAHTARAAGSADVYPTSSLLLARTPFSRR
jgi:hypothetical protein